MGSTFSKNPEEKPFPKKPTLSFGIAPIWKHTKQITVQPPHVPSFDLYKNAKSSKEWDRDKFDQRLNQNILEQAITQKQIDSLDKARYEIRLKRVAYDQTVHGEHISRDSTNTSIPYFHLNSIKRKIDGGNLYKGKYFSVKPKRPELNESIKNHIANVSRSQPSNELLIELDGVQILRKDIQTLLGTNWLNDEIINAFMHLLVCRGKNPNNKKIYAYNTFFYPKLRDSGYSSIKRWTRKVDIFSHDMLLVPVHLGNHWCLAVIDINHKKISYYDSLGGSAGSCCRLLLDYLKEEMNDKKKQCFDKENWSLAEFKGGIGGIPRQENGSDCGVFACIYAEYITRSAKFDFAQRDMPYFRQKMIYEITKGVILE